MPVCPTAMLPSKGGVTDAHTRPSSKESVDAPTRDYKLASSFDDLEHSTGLHASKVLHALEAPWEPAKRSPLSHFYVDVLHADESMYDIGEWHIAIHPTFHAHLQDHQEDNISQFLALLEVIPTRKRKRHQPLLDFNKSKILASIAYI